jgi:hypothetical protein
MRRTKSQNKQTRPKVNRKRESRRLRKKRFVAPRTLEQYSAMAEHDQKLWDDIGQIITEVKNGSSLRQASRKFDLDPRIAQRLARPALQKLRNGRWAAKNRDKLLRVLPVPASEGLREIGVPDSKQATLLGKYWSAVELYLRTGDASALEKFAGEHIVDASGKRYPLLTNLQELDRLGSAGAFSFETLYRKAS